MAQNKTRPTTASVAAFLDAVEPESRGADARAISGLMARVSGELPVMWGSSIVGFGRYHYRYDSGREGEMCRIGFSPRKGSFALYIKGGFARHEVLLAELGRFRTSGECLNVKRLADIDALVLEQLIGESLDHMREIYPA